MDASFLSECDFARNDGEVTVLADMTFTSEALPMSIREDAEETHKHVAGKQDGSDSGVELNGAERSSSPVLDATMTGSLPGPPAHLDYDGTSEGGSESSSVLSHTPARKKISSASSCSMPGRSAAHPRSRSVAGAGSSSATSSPFAGTPTSRPRERSLATRGSSCTRGRQGSGSDGGGGAPTSARPSSRAQRSSSTSTTGANPLMTSSLTGSLTMSSNVRGRGTSRASVSSGAPRAAPRGSAAAAMTASTDDGRWPSTAQRERPTTLCRTRASSVVTSRDRRGMTSSSSKNSVNSINSASTPSPTVESKSEKFSTLPRRRRRRSVESVDRTTSASSQTARKLKVTLYHETSAQTALTNQDLEDILGGKACHLRPVDAKEQCHQEVQVDRERDDFAALLLDKRLRAIIDMLGFEHLGAPRSPGASISSTVQTPPKEIDHLEWSKSLELLEQRATTVKKRDLLQRNEIGRLRNELDHVDRLRKRLQSRQEEAEAESVELQEFLQEEKSVLSESLKEAEKEVQTQKQIAEGLRDELERQREECQHLVRISEQRRQEILTLQARVGALEQRSKESLLQQGAAVSGCSVALSALSSRLDELASQLEESSVDKALSALNVEAEAVTTRTKEVCRPLSIHFENNFQILDNVTEPELEEEGGGQRDCSTSDAVDTHLANSESIQNLSAAIFRRLQEEATKCETNSADEAPGHLIDQVLDVDSSVTRLLRAIRDAVNKNPEDTSQNVANSQKVENKAIQKIEGPEENSKPNHISLLNGSNDGSCCEGKTVAVSLTTEPVTGAA